MSKLCLQLVLLHKVARNAALKDKSITLSAKTSFYPATLNRIVHYFVFFFICQVLSVVCSSSCMLKKTHTEFHLLARQKNMFSLGDWLCWCGYWSLEVRTSLRVFLSQMVWSYWARLTSPMPPCCTTQHPMWLHGTTLTYIFNLISTERNHEYTYIWFNVKLF